MKNNLFLFCIFFAHENTRKIIFFIKLKIIIRVSNVFEHACLCIRFIEMWGFDKSSEYFKLIFK